MKATNEMHLDLTVALTLGMAQAINAYAEKKGIGINDAVLDIIEKGLDVKPAAAPMTVWDATCIVLDKARDLPVGVEFLLADVLPSTVRDQMAHGDKRAIGKKFRAQVEKDGIARFLRHRSDKNALYIKL